MGRGLGKKGKMLSRDFKFVYRCRAVVWPLGTGLLCVCVHVCVIVCEIGCVCVCMMDLWREILAGQESISGECLV